MHGAVGKGNLVVYAQRRRFQVKDVLGCFQDALAPVGTAHEPPLGKMLRRNAEGGLAPTING